jgi:hypothetical protein
LQNDLDLIQNWCHENGMRVNIDKTHHLIIHSKSDYVDSELKYNNISIKRVDQDKMLGVTFDSSLSLEKHREDVYRKSIVSINFITRNYKSYSSNTRILLFRSLVEPISRYCNVIWCNSSNKCEKLVNRIY